MSFDIIQTTHDFLKTNDIRLIAGRDFSKDHASDSSGLMLNETAVKRMGLKDPIGEQVFLMESKGLLWVYLLMYCGMSRPKHCILWL
ncbi:ABC transporter permease [Pedobacter steynii]